MLEPPGDLLMLRSCLGEPTARAHRTARWRERREELEEGLEQRQTERRGVGGGMQRRQREK